MKKILMCVVVLCFVSSLSCIAQWSDTGVVACDTNANAGFYAFPKIASDGEGGAYICWRDSRKGDYDIYTQHVDNTGRMTWQRNGIPIVIAANDQDFPRITPDGQGGAFIAWEDSRAGNYTYPYVQRVDKKGNCLWQTNGVKAADYSGLFISIVSDGKDGLLLGWNVNGGNFDDVAVQRLDALGNRMWGDSGVQVTNRPGVVASGDVAVIGDGTGGGIVTWAEGVYPNYRVYAQRIDSAGNTCWQTNGILFSDSTWNVIDVNLSSDLKKGAFVNWAYDDASGVVQRINQAGQFLWSSGGIPLTLSGAGGVLRNSSDGHGGAFIGHGRRIHYLDSLGTKVWGDSGTAYISTLGVTNSSQVPDEHQGIFNFAEYFQNGIGRYIQAQWIDHSGAARFGTNGKNVTSNPNELQFWPSAATDGRGGALVCWNDFRRGYSDVYVARVDTSGTVTGVKDDREGLIPASLKLEQNYPNPFNPETRISFSLSERSFVQLIVYDLLGRKIKTLLEEEQNPGQHSIRFDSKDLGSGTYFYCLMANDKMISKKMMVLR